MNHESLTISELNRFIKDVIGAGFPQPLWVCGEIQQYDRSKGKKHCFFELVEKAPSSHEITARIGLVIFANRKAAIEEILRRSENAFELKDDIEVKFLCRVDFYEPHGAIRLIVESIDPAHTLGKIAQHRQRLIAELKDNGVLDKNKQRPLPVVPLNVGLITSHDSAAYNDFVSELKRSGYGFRIYLRNTLMQGKKCENDVCRALDELQRESGLDVIVITRGGGSIAELSCFDSRLIAERIAISGLPVLSGIGHEINTTITDMAAHTYAKTPTAIAQYLVSRVNDFLEEINEKRDRILLDARDMLATGKQRLKDLAAGLQRGTTLFFKDHHAQIIRLQEILKHKPGVLVNDQRNSLKAYQRIVEIAHPMNTMKRGFSITRGKDGRILRSVSQARVDQEITTEVVDGNVRSKVLQ